MAKKRVLYFDVLNIAACYLVVLAHATGRVFTFDTSRSWYISMFLQTIMHWSIPVFFMLSGATLIDYKERYSTKEFLCRRVKRIVVPFLIWSVIYLFWKVSRNEIILTNWYESLQLFFNNGIISRFWFFYAIIPLYLLTPVFALFVNKQNIKYVKYLVWLLFAGVIVFPTIQQFVLPLSSYFKLPYEQGYILYFLLGWLLHNTEMKKSTRILIYFGGILGACIMFFGTPYLSLKAGMLNRALMSFQSFDCFLMSVAVFVFAKSKDWKILSKCAKPLKIISGTSFGVYLLHTIILTYLKEYVFLTDMSVRYMVLGSVSAYFICVFIVLMVKKIPGLKILFP